MNRVTFQIDRKAGIVKHFLSPCSFRSTLPNQWNQIKALLSFTDVFKGTHVNNTELVKIFTGKKVHMQFSGIRDAEVDGDTVSKVDEYWAEI